MATINIVTEGSLLIVNVAGELTADEAIAVVKEHYPTNLIKDVIWDLTNGTMKSICFSGFHKMARTVKMYVSYGARKNGRTAFVATNDDDYAANRMYAVMAEVTGVPIMYKVCRTIDEARDWIQREA